MKINKDTVVWITGASSGIGEALSYAFAQKGAKVILSARRKEELERVSMGCVAGNVHILPLDLEQSQLAEEWVKDAIHAFGKVDVLINNGGIGHLGTSLEMKEEVERRVMEINYFGQVNLTRALLPHLLERRSGTVVAISSILGWFGSPRLAAYAASKHALKGYFESLREEVRNKGLNVMVVFPGFINTQVTIRSLGPNGETINKNSPAQENGMPPEVFAQKLIRRIEKDKWFATIGGWEVNSIPFYKWLPRTFYKTMSWLSDRQKKGAASSH